ncbi:hypothetical protein LTR36_003790 [Oleoguttula mirabilis]|uniref:C2H2-type domain-containing protein n=1 Tax=Oleoguttula mirabilis TaxID=1507867 RepID=A0AAV9JIC6_9PEZI|nr:hypothetical protein LTR36_003790 [Oleoguttula mirabilis]
MSHYYVLPALAPTVLVIPNDHYAMAVEVGYDWRKEGRLTRVEDRKDGMAVWQAVTLAPDAQVPPPATADNSMQQEFSQTNSDDFNGDDFDGDDSDGVDLDSEDEAPSEASSTSTPPLRCPLPDCRALVMRANHRRIDLIGHFRREHGLSLSDAQLGHENTTLSIMEQGDVFVAGWLEDRGVSAAGTLFETLAPTEEADGTESEDPEPDVSLGIMHEVQSEVANRDPNATEANDPIPAEYGDTPMRELGANDVGYRNHNFNEASAYGHGQKEVNGYGGDTIEDQPEQRLETPAEIGHSRQRLLERTGKGRIAKRKQSAPQPEADSEPARKKKRHTEHVDEEEEAEREQEADQQHLPTSRWKGWDYTTTKAAESVGEGVGKMSEKNILKGKRSRPPIRRYGGV